LKNKKLEKIGAYFEDNEFFGQKKGDGAQIGGLYPEEYDDYFW
jgi:hypothetical protein